MLKNINKSILYVSLTLVTGSFIFFGCTKALTEDSPVINTPLTIRSSSEKIDIRASDVTTTNQIIKRKIELIDKSNNSVRDTYVITVQSSDGSSDIVSAIKRKKFTGTMTIESDKIVYLKKEFHNGRENVSSNDNLNSPKTKMLFENIEAPNTCKLSLISNCVSKKIDDMNFAAYILCLVAAPECYAGVWAECTLLFCVTGEQNRTNI